MKRIVLVLTVIGITSSLLLMFAAYVFEDEIIASAKSAINEKVDTPIDVDQIQFSFLKDFPRASLIFKNVRIQDKFDENKDLLAVEQVSLQFNALGLLSQNYDINRATLNQGVLNMYVTEEGLENFIFWKEEPSESQVNFDIEDIRLQGVNFTYLDESAKLDIASYFPDANLSVIHKDEHYLVKGDLEGERASLRIEELDYLVEKDLGLSACIRIIEEGSQIQFKEVIFDFSEQRIPLFGSMIKEDNWVLDLKSESDIDLESVIANLPEDIVGDLSSNSLKGDLGYDLHITGQSSETLSPNVKVDFEWKRGKLRFSEEASVLTAISAVGRYERNDKGRQSIRFDELNGSVPEGQLSFKGTVTNLASPWVEGDFTCRSEFKDLIALSPQEQITDAHGDVDIRLSINGLIPRGEWTEAKVDKMNMLGSARLQDLGFSLASNGYQCEDLSAEIVLKDDDLIFEQTALQLNQDLLEITGSLDGLWAYLLSDQGQLKVRGEVKSKQINWDKWALAAEPYKGGTTQLPEAIDVQLSMAFDAFTFREFKATDLKGIVNLADNNVSIGPLLLESCGGKVGAEILLVQRENLTWQVQMDGNLTAVEVPELFRQFGQFGQEFIADHQLRGRGDARIEFKASTDSDMQILSKSIQAKADIIINDGELIEHPSMVSIVDQLRERQLLKPFVRADELEQELHHLKFEKLQNTIRIENGLLHIPEMTIASNSLKVGMSGRHSFDNEIDYSIDFTLRDILVNKSNPEFLIQDDGLGHRIHLRMRGNTDNPIIEIDKDALKENRREALAEAKEDIKEFFNNPFKKKDEDKADQRAEVVVQLEGEQIEEEPKKTTAKKEKKKWWKVEEGEEEEEPTLDEDEDDF